MLITFMLYVKHLKTNLLSLRDSTMLLRLIQCLNPLKRGDKLPVNAFYSIYTSMKLE